MLSSDKGYEICLVVNIGFAGLPSFTPVIYPNPATLESSSEEEEEDEPPLANRNIAYATSR